jgi:hypothetical protein
MQNKKYVILFIKINLNLKGPRWGPGGRGDTSGVNYILCFFYNLEFLFSLIFVIHQGCRCNVNGLCAKG